MRAVIVEEDGEDAALPVAVLHDLKAVHGEGVQEANWDGQKYIYTNIKIKLSKHRVETKDAHHTLLQTCLKDGLCYSAPLASPVGDDGDNISLPRLQTSHRKTDLAGAELHFNCLRTKATSKFYLTEYKLD